ncbi:glycosyltransferase family 2 protein [Kaistia dalseonensis]|uniref:Cellulose synthase/poly-beta-1,6-N-acetylglucosamine synthase-like glycosyltransferase n=1 Tax=Kaistia dalseonensis TaxID=410840 RepID=A0ABU0HA34_9HYPH|nr:glycosyltransferase family 2 protein [Kaistia dalseonensis]MCX5496518.1 glycosyltransferase family 2 protein [Kaistia dalseonensis]MDQ0439140.1 cellulose synthase/poly-beta-1,6-N-acetylglucosamine synthase-like glycosyltransferase [Kaistia dalseonensis]
MRVLVLLVISVICFSALGLHLHLNVEMQLIDRVLYYGLLIGLFYCCISYQVSRYGSASRAALHRSFDDEEVDYLLSPDAPTITILIPSYREEKRVIIMTMLSAAIARYSNRRIVLLVDDPPKDRASISNTLAAVAEVRRIIATPMTAFRSERDAWYRRYDAGKIGLRYEAERLALNYRRAALWLEGRARDFEADIAPEFVHVDSFFIERIVRDLARHYHRVSEAIAKRPLTVDEIDGEYERLASLFCDDITSFQRKAFDNLSHAPNKAMNLNAYIGLMGGSYVVRQSGRQRFFEPSAPSPESIAIPGSTYVLTLDADSVILGDYMLQLAHVLESHPRRGVAQTPYLAFPNSREVVERIAGATTDIQYLIHQGATFYNASYWVGANALIRFEALEDIRREQVEGHKTCPVYIQDETVIEDTGSTIDLLNAGWAVHNFFAPLAYSATPGDFGALAIQRKRWSNGGLIIFPMLLRQFLGSPGRLRRLPELTLRSHYLLSPLIGNAAVFTLMVWASKDGRALIWTPFVMIPYFLLYGTDLKKLGYRIRDLFAVCSLNLMLLPVSFAGIAASIRQVVTGRKGSFSRTPKVANRTFVPPYAFLFNSFMLTLMSIYVVQGMLAREYLGTIIPAANVTLYFYGLHRFIGFRNGVSDLVLSLRTRLADAMEWLPAISFAPFAGRRGRLAGVALVSSVLILTPHHFGATGASTDVASARGMRPVGPASFTTTPADASMGMRGTIVPGGSTASVPSDAGSLALIDTNFGDPTLKAGGVLQK